MNLLDLQKLVDATRGIAQSTNLFALSGLSLVPIERMGVKGLEKSNEPPIIVAELASGTEALSTIPASDGNPASAVPSTSSALALVQELETRASDIFDDPDLSQRLLSLCRETPLVGAPEDELLAEVESHKDEEFIQKLAALLPATKLTEMDASIEQIVDELEYRKDELLASGKEVKRLTALLGTEAKPAKPGKDTIIEEVLSHDTAPSEGKKPKSAK